MYVVYVYTAATARTARQCATRRSTITSDALIGDPASLSRTVTAGPPGREAKKWRYMREYVPENQGTKCVSEPQQSRYGDKMTQTPIPNGSIKIKRLPDLEKACIRMPWGVSEKKQAFLIYL